MRAIDTLIDEYGASHQNPLNKLLHWICVPAILWTVVALLWAIPFPGKLETTTAPLNWAVVAMLLVQVYYFRLSISLALGFLLLNVSLLMLTGIAEAASPWPLWQLALAVFVIAWIGQFIGHAIEGKRPSFFKDLQFLLIGPAWLLAAIYRLAGLKY